MSSIQKQDLLVFSDSSVISKGLFGPGVGSNMILVTDTAATSGSWLLNALVEAVTLGSVVSLNGGNGNSGGIGARVGKVVVGSFLSMQTQIVGAFEKSKIPRDRYTVLPLAEDIVSKNVGKPIDVIVGGILKQFEGVEGSIFVLEKPEILMSLFNMSSDDLQLRLINPLLRKCSMLIVSTSVEAFDNDFPENIGRDTVEFVRFTTSSFHKCAVVLSVRPLDTGKAKDITGTLAIRRGGALLNATNAALHVVENQYLFHSVKDVTTLFYR
ncbi:elongator complex protein 6 [Kluyveromyces marxianus]|uniref:Elongator complex protein 6 n=2 Tax=Kluyveromyces marxianus TaxID=4911 RepID=W0T5N3_KLUMD|nr:elongator complex protein 6 [Kluyveromyces marxianus DMKU3-1042]QGN13692.1 elongator complex protein 6 [Kluyveromyces marxianus]BAO38131.1 elongator complex protein 6 [Kluyveromyces marxianus DMKU3-1042]BAP69699.1 elongator complex protein 6 [Kluyveromyces marxianus]